MCRHVGETAPVLDVDLRARAHEARQLMRSCCLCARRCAVDRVGGERGYCGLDGRAYWFRELVHYGVEYELIPAHAIYLAGCNMRCGFCTAEAWNADPTAQEPWDAAAMGRRVLDRRREGARTLLFVGGEPTLSLAAVLDLLAALPEHNPVVWDSNLYFSAEARALLRGVVDVYVADFKFGNDRCAHDVADTPRYVQTVTENLRFAQETAALIVRHLLMPGHLDCCCRPVLEWIGHELPGARVSLQGTYMPPARAPRQAGLADYVRDDEYERARALAAAMGIELVA